MAKRVYFVVELDEDRDLYESRKDDLFIEGKSFTYWLVLL